MLGNGNRPAARTARQPKRARNPDREGALPVRRSLWSYGHLLLRSAKLDPRARREGVLEANGVFSRLIGEGSGLREERIARIRLRHLRVEKGYRVNAMADRQRSLPSLVRQPPDRYRSDRGSRFGYVRAAGTVRGWDGLVISDWWTGSNW